MFNYEEESPSPAALAMIQIVGAPFFGMIFGFIAALLIDAILPIHSPWVRDDLAGYPGFTLAGLYLGYVVRKSILRAVQHGGLWVWVIPVCLVAYCAFDSRHRPGEILALFIGDSNGEKALGQLFFTWPACAACAYSVGIVLADRPAKAPYFPAG